MTAGVIGFGIFALLMIVLAVFVIRFSMQLNRDRGRGRDRRSGGDLGSGRHGKPN